MTLFADFFADTSPKSQQESQQNIHNSTGQGYRRVNVAGFFAETSPKSQHESQQNNPNSTGHGDRRGTVC